MNWRVLIGLGVAGAAAVAVALVSRKPKEAAEAEAYPCENCGKAPWECAGCHCEHCRQEPKESAAVESLDTWQSEKSQSEKSQSEGVAETPEGDKDLSQLLSSLKEEQVDEFYPLISILEAKAIEGEAELNRAISAVVEWILKRRKSTGSEDAKA